MDLILIIALVMPIIIAGVVLFFLKETITILEAGVQIIIPILIISLTWWAGRYADTWDTELWNGEVTNKEIVRKNCPWGWRDYQDSFCTEYRTRTVPDGQICTTTTDSKGKTTRSCRPKYKTQYKYIYDWEQKFFVYTNINATYMIARVDRQGARTPEFFAQTYVGQPASKQHGYTNWIRGAAHSIFHQDGQAEEKYLTIMPEYPISIHDYFHADRVVKVGQVVVPETLNQQLGEQLKILGPKRQMNAVVVVVDAKLAGPDFAQALRRYWMGFKKNDAVIFLGVDGSTLKWADVMSWSKKSIFDISLRDKLWEQIGKPVDYSLVMSELMVQGMAHYERREMAEFEYLKEQIPVPTWLTILALMLSVGGSIGLVFVFHNIDLANIGKSNIRIRRI